MEDLFVVTHYFIPRDRKRIALFYYEGFNSLSEAVADTNVFDACADITRLVSYYGSRIWTKESSVYAPLENTDADLTPQFSRLLGNTEADMIAKLSKLFFTFDGEPRYLLKLSNSDLRDNAKRLLANGIDSDLHLAMSLISSGAGSLSAFDSMMKLDRLNAKQVDWYSTTILQIMRNNKPSTLSRVAVCASDIFEEYPFYEKCEYPVFEFTIQSFKFIKRTGAYKITFDDPSLPDGSYTIEISLVGLAKTFLNFLQDKSPFLAELHIKPSYSSWLSIGKVRHFYEQLSFTMNYYALQRNYCLDFYYE